MSYSQAVSGRTYYWKFIYSLNLNQNLCAEGLCGFNKHKQAKSGIISFYTQIGKLTYTGITQENPVK